MPAYAGYGPMVAADQNVSCFGERQPPEAALAARVAEVEKALKKIDDKAKEDKSKAAGKMSATPGGRIHIDTAAFSQDAIDKARHDEQNGVEFRTARLAIYGGGFDIIKYQIEYDFAGKDKVRCKDTYFAITDLPLVQNIQIGHFKEPYSLDELTSDNYITFMERSTANDVMAPKRHIGVMAFGNTASGTRHVRHRLLRRVRRRRRRRSERRHGRSRHHARHLAALVRRSHRRTRPDPYRPRLQPSRCLQTTNSSEVPSRVAPGLREQPDADRRQRPRRDRRGIGLRLRSAFRSSRSTTSTTSTASTIPTARRKAPMPT